MTRQDRTVMIGRSLRSTRTGHRVTAGGIPPRETRELVRQAGIRGVAVACAELRDRRRARLIGRWTDADAATSEMAA